MKQKIFITTLFLTFLTLNLGAFAQNPATNTADQDYKAYKKTSFSNPEWDPFVEEGFQDFDKQDIPNTIEFLRKAVTLGCMSPIVLFKLALSYEGSGIYYSSIQYYELAQEQFKKANQDHRYYKEFDENYGRALYLMGQEEKALPILTKAAETTQSYWLLKLMAQMAMSKNDLETATKYYDRALAGNDPAATPQERFTILLILARTYANKENATLAVSYYQKLLEIDENNKEAQGYIQQQQAAMEKEDKKGNNVIEQVYEIMGHH